jgi:hypothetical protein
MDVFTKLFGDLLVFVYHCFDRIVIHGYLSGLSRPEQVVHFFRQRRGRGGEQGGVEPAHRRLPELGGSLRPQSSHPDRVGREGRAQGRPCSALAAPHGQERRLRGLFHLQSMEQGPSFRVSMPKYPTQDPHYRILAAQRSRFTHYYFYIRDEVLGPMVMRVASFFPFQTTHYLNGHSRNVPVAVEIGRQASIASGR